MLSNLTSELLAGWAILIKSANFSWLRDQRVFKNVYSGNCAFIRYQNVIFRLKFRLKRYYLAVCVSSTSLLLTYCLFNGRFAKIVLDLIVFLTCISDALMYIIYWLRKPSTRRFFEIMTRSAAVTAILGYFKILPQSKPMWTSNRYSVFDYRVE